MTTIGFGDRMTFTPGLCPECGKKPSGIEQLMKGRSNLGEHVDGTYGFTGETEAFDDDQEDVKNAEGQLMLLCDDGHEWWADVAKQVPAGDSPA